MNHRNAIERAASISFLMATSPSTSEAALAVNIREAIINDQLEQLDIDHAVVAGSIAANCMENVLPKSVDGVYEHKAIAKWAMYVMSAITDGSASLNSISNSTCKVDAKLDEIVEKLTTVRLIRSECCCFLVPKCCTEHQTVLSHKISRHFYTLTFWRSSI